MSIACWVVVFTPQIFENFRRASANGLSLLFVVVWLTGDIFNILGGVLQGVLPTMLILAVYYACADTLLFGQCLYYRGFRLGDKLDKLKEVVSDRDEEATEGSSLLRSGHEEERRDRPTKDNIDGDLGEGSSSLLRTHLMQVDATHLSPAVPLTSIATPAPIKPTSTLTSILFNATAILLVVIVGVLGWYVTTPSTHGYAHLPHSNTPSETKIHFDPLGQTFGYLCAVFYLASRIPQILLNHRRRSTEGVAILFFLFACVGNFTYVMSVLAYRPPCAEFYDNDDNSRDGWCEEGEWRRQYLNYIFVNASWIIGSAGTLLLDFVIFGQFWIYQGQTATESS